MFRHRPKIGGGASSSSGGGRTGMLFVLIAFSLRQQVYEQSVRAGHTRWQLPEEREAGVHVAALAVARDEQAAELSRFLRIGQLEHRRVARIVGLGEVQSA